MSDKKQTKSDFLAKFLNQNRRKAMKTVVADAKKSSTATCAQQTKDDDWLTKQALEEIERKANLHRIKKESFGSSSQPKNTANKKFLKNTLSSCISHNKRETDKNETNSKDKLKELERRDRLRKSSEKFGTRVHEFQKPEKKRKRSSSDDS